MISDISQENYQIDFSEMMKELSAVPTPHTHSLLEYADPVWEMTNCF